MRSSISALKRIMVDSIALCELNAALEKIRVGAPVSEDLWAVDKPVNDR